MESKDLELRILCAVATAERDGFVHLADALYKMLDAIVASDTSCSISPIDDPKRYVAAAPHTLVIQ